MDPRGGGQEIPRSHLVGFFGAENQRGSHGTSSGSHEFSVTPSRLCDEVAQLTEMVRRQQEALTKFLKENEELKTSVNDVKSEIKTLRKELAEKSDDNTSSSSGAAKRSCKLDTKLTLAVRNLHDAAENQYDGSKAYNDPYNQSVVQYLVGELTEKFEEKPIKKAVYRYYESRRRMYLDEQPERAAIKAENDRKTKLKSRQRQLYDRRLKLCMTKKERKHWGQINDLYMSEESDDGEGSFRVHSPSWRSQKLEDFIQELDSRQKRKLFKKPRIQSTSLVGSPPKNAPAWAVQNQGTPNTAAMPAVAEVEDFSLSQSQHRPLQPVLQNYVQPHQGSFSEFPVGSSQGMYSNSSLNYTTPPPQNGYAAEEYQQISRAVPYYEGGIGLPRSTGSLPTSGSLGNQSTTPTRPASVRSRNQVVNDIFSDSDS